MKNKTSLIANIIATVCFLIILFDLSVAYSFIKEGKGLMAFVATIALPFLFVNCSLLFVALVLGWCGYILKKVGLTTAFAIINMITIWPVIYISTSSAVFLLISSILGFIGAKKQKELNLHTVNKIYE